MNTGTEGGKDAYREGGMSRGGEWVTDGEMNGGRDWWREEWMER